MADPPPDLPDYDVLARRLELIGAKAQTLAIELRQPHEYDPTYPAQLAEYLRDLYLALEDTVSDISLSADRWSRA